MLEVQPLQVPAAVQLQIPVAMAGATKTASSVCLEDARPRLRLHVRTLDREDQALLEVLEAQRHRHLRQKTQADLEVQVVLVVRVVLAASRYLCSRTK